MATVTREQELLSVIYKLTDALEQANGRLWKCGGESVTPEMTESERAALASPPAEDVQFARIHAGTGRPWSALELFLLEAASATGDARYQDAAMLIHAAAQAPPASDPPGPTVINEDDGDVTIDFDYANDRVVSIRLGEESSGLSAFVDGESYALCPLDRVPPRVLALLRTEAKAVTLRQSDPPGLATTKGDR